MRWIWIPIGPWRRPCARRESSRCSALF